MIIILMGVSGCGKTEIGQRLSGQLGWPFFEADAFHPRDNIDRMSRGDPLDDADRWTWLENIRQQIDQCEQDDQNAVIACSALKQSYRDLLAKDTCDVRFVYLHGDYDLIHKRLTARRGHFMKAQMLDSQFATLEPPTHALTIDVDQTPDTIVRMIRSNSRI